MVVGGIWSLIKLIPPLIEGIRSSLLTYSKQNTSQTIPLEEQDFPIKYVIGGIALLFVPVIFLYLEVVIIFLQKKTPLN